MASPPSTISSPFQRSSANPRASKPGPRFADDAGARTWKRSGMDHTFKRVAGCRNLDRAIGVGMRRVPEVVVHDGVSILKHVASQNADDDGVPRDLAGVNEFLHAGQAGSGRWLT